MKCFELITGNEYIWLSVAHIVSVRPNSSTGSLVRMANGDQWALTHDTGTVLEAMGYNE